MLGKRGMQVCDINLICGTQTEARGPILVSPDGTKILVGTGQRRSQKLFDFSLKEITFVPRPVSDVAIPGDRSFLVNTREGVYILDEDGHEVSIKLDASSGWRSNRFLNSSTLAMLIGNRSQAVVMSLNGNELYRLKVPETWKAEFVISERGRRFGLSRYGFTVTDYLLNFFNLLDPEETRRPNLQVLQVLETLSGKQVAAYEWDPRGNYIVPAISPSGTRVARIRSGTLEVFEIP